MAQGRSKLGKFDVVASGSIVGRHSDEVDIYPFSHSPEYCIRFIHKGVSEGPDNKTSINLVKENLVQMELTHKWSFPNNLTVSRTVIGGDSEHLFCMNYHINFVGDLENYTFIFTYTVYAEPIK